MRKTIVGNKSYKSYSIRDWILYTFFFHFLNERKIISETKRKIYIVNRTELFIDIVNCVIQELVAMVAEFISTKFKGYFDERLLVWKFFLILY